MPRLIEAPQVIEAVGSKPKRIEEYAGRVRTSHERVSVARMVSPEGWQEPGQRPEFEEISVVLRGLLRVEHEAGTLDVREGQAVVATPGEWVRYGTPEPGGAEYLAHFGGIAPPASAPWSVNEELFREFLFAKCWEQGVHARYGELFLGPAWEQLEGSLESAFGKPSAARS